MEAYLPETLESVRTWHPDAERALQGAQDRLLGAASLWGLQDLEPLAGGSMSAVCRATCQGASVVVKAPLETSDAGREGSALLCMSSTGLLPALLDFHEGVLLLERVEGVTPPSTDAGTLVTALEGLHAAPYTTYGHPSWEERSALLFEEYAQRAQSRPEMHGLLQEALDALPQLLQGERLLLHGDLQPKNVLVGPRVRLIDPLPVVAPLGWEVAHAACSVVAAGGDGAEVLEAGRRLRIEGPEARGWLSVAAVHHACTTANMGSAPVYERLQQLVSSTVL